MMDECGETAPMDESQRVAAARLVCGNAQGDSLEEQIADAKDLVYMLGLHPSQKDEAMFTAPAPLMNTTGFAS